MDNWLEEAYEDRTYLPDDEDGYDYYDEFLPDYCKQCGEHLMDCLCDIFDDEGRHIGEY